MSQSGKASAAIIEAPPQGDEQRPLTSSSPALHPEPEHPGKDDDHEAKPEAEAGEGQEAGKKSRPRFPFAHVGGSARAKWKRETRFGIAALLSFVILVTVLIVNKGKPGGAKSPEKSGRPILTAAIPPRSKETAPAQPKAEPAAPAETTGPAVTGTQSDLPTFPGMSNPGPSEAGPATGEGVVPAAAEASALPLPPTQSTAGTEESSPAPVPAPAPPPGSENTASNEPGQEPLLPAPAPVTPPSNDPQAAGPLTAPGPAPSTEPVPAHPATGSDLPTPPNTPAPPPFPAPEAAGPGESPSLPAGNAGQQPQAQPQLPMPSPEREPVAPQPQRPEPTSPPPAPSGPAAEELPAAPPAPPAPEPAAPAPPARLKGVPNLSTTPANSAMPSVDSTPPEYRPGKGTPIPNAGRQRTFDDDLPGSPAPVAAGRPGPARPADEDVVEPVPHVVASGENFFTISKLHYNSGRYWKALWKANSDIVPAPEKLWVGTTIRIPPPEALDRSLIEPARVARSAPASGETTPLRKTSQAAAQGADSSRPETRIRRSSEIELALPVADPFSTRDSKLAASEPFDSGSVVRSRSSRPRHRVRDGETLRSIARDTLGNSRRYREILDLNRDVIDDPNNLAEGQYLELPEDARLGRRSR